MFSNQSGAFCFLGASSNSAVFLSDEDVKGLMDPELGFLVRPTIHECQTSSPEDNNNRHELEERNDDNVNVTVPVSPLKLKLQIPLITSESEKEESNEDGLKTPTSSDHKIPVIGECPGAPKKVKTKPAMKRKACRRRIVFDLKSKVMESLFPVPFLVDLGGKNKKVKQCSNKCGSKTW